eukprot:TRINITY_DN793_c0_g1_i4.p1 TRINITY_DN793_c0_g1~~TRINITY_DN793_c0_g1_i4.p1  ORF type:complete len:158 (-),score=45.22 TRINITY_DN793_c0_g1_i4:55-528(-)
MIRRPPRSTLSSSSAASDVYKRQLISYTQDVVGHVLEQRGVVVPLCSSTLLHALLDVAGEPVKALVESLSGGGAATLEEPGALTEGVETKLFGDIGGGHGLGEILLVGEDEEDGVAELILGKHLLAVSYTHLRAHETPEHLVCRLLLEKKKKKHIEK